MPFCEKCNQYRFPVYNVAVSMIVVNEQNGKIMLIQQYGKPVYILVAGYINRGEQAENAVAREIKEETGMTVSHINLIALSSMNRQIHLCAILRHLLKMTVN